MFSKCYGSTRNVFKSWFLKSNKDPILAITIDRLKTRCVKCVPKCASARVSPSNIVYLSYGYRSTGTGVLTTEVLLFRQYLNKWF